MLLGLLEGDRLGLCVGSFDGALLGAFEGDRLGLVVGSVDGWTEGDVVGELVSGFDPAETTGKIKSSASS